MKFELSLHTLPPKRQRENGAWNYKSVEKELYHDAETSNSCKWSGHGSTW